MSSYCQINKILNNDDLDRMAREINNNKKNNSRDIYYNYRNTYSNTCDKDKKTLEYIDNLNSDKGVKIVPNTVSQGFYTAQGDYANIDPQEYKKSMDKKCLNFSSNKVDKYGYYNEYNDTTINDINATPEHSIKHKFKGENKQMWKQPLTTMPLQISAQMPDSSNSSDLLKLSDSLELSSLSSLSSDSYNSSESEKSLSSSITWNTEDIKFEDINNIKKINDIVKRRSKYNGKKHKNKTFRYKCKDFDIDSVDSLESLNSGESLLNHIQRCHNCKKKIINLIRKDNNACIDIASDMEYITKNRINSHNTQIKNNAIDTKNANDNEHKKINDVSVRDTIDILNNNYMPELKEIIAICLVGFLIIIILDLVINSS